MSKRSLKIKQYPEFLENRRITILWPGDPACDLERSDLTAWAKSLGETGLVAKQGAELTPVLCRRLTPQELPIAERSFRDDARAGVALAASMGMLALGDESDAIPRHRNIQGLSVIPDHILEPLLYHDDWRAELPFLPFLRSCYSGIGITVGADDSLDSTLETASIASVAGAAILARSFRTGRRSL